MRRFVIFLLFLIFTSSTLFAQQNKAKGKIAKDLVEKGIQYYLKYGDKKAYAEFNNKKGQFTEGEYYLFAATIDSEKSSIITAHGGSPGLVGKDLFTIKDPDKNQIGNLFISALKNKDSAWVTYRWTNPATRKIAVKETFLKRIPGKDLFIGCGYYQ